MGLAILSCVSLALAEPSCDECLGAIDSLVARLTSDDSLAEQAAILVGALCPGAADPADCEARLPAGWAQVGQVLFPEFLQGAPICGDCEAAVAYIVELMNDAEEVAAAIDFLSGDALCAGDAQCATDIGALLPPAMQVLAAAFTETQAEICQDIAGVC